ncbi:MAG: hypothetical protein EXR71_16850 [Myxococcales bacterium]|nr:hypothetical protein [Myxococcales bacterium]
MFRNPILGAGSRHGQNDGGLVVGRKVWLFAGSEGVAHAGAVMFTQIVGGAMQGIDPWVPAGIPGLLGIGPPAR